MGCIVNTYEAEWSQADLMEWLKFYNNVTLIPILWRYTLFNLKFSVKYKFFGLSPTSY